MNEFTVEDVVRKLTVTREEAYGLVRFLRAAKLIEEVGQKPAKKGKGASIYAPVENMGAKLHVLIQPITREGVGKLPPLTL